MFEELMRQFMLWAPDEGGGGAAAPAEATPTETTPAETEGETQTDTPAEETEVVHTIAQSKLDDRIERARREGVTKLLKELGVDKPEDLTAIVQSEKDRRNGELTELQRAQQDLETAKTESTGWKTKYEGLLVQMQTGAVDSTIRAAAVNAKHPEDVIVWVRQNGGEDVAKIAELEDEKLKVNETLAKQLVAKCLKARPEWFNTQTPGIPSSSGGQGPGTASDVQRIAEVAQRQVRSFL